MEHRWSLNELYDSFEGENFKNDVKLCEKYIENFKAWVNKNTEDNENVKEKLEEYIKSENEFSDLVMKIMNYCELTLSVDTKNEVALKNLEMIEEKLTETAEPSAKVTKWIGSIKDIDKIIESSEELKEHSFYIKELCKMSKYILTDKEEVVIAKMRNTGSSAWAKLQDVLTSTLVVDANIKGEEKKVPLTVIRNMAYDKDKEVRKDAYISELKAYEKIKDSSAACLNGIKGEVITTCKMRGYKSPLEETLINSRMDKESLDAMLSAMKESMPVFRKYFKRKAELLGDGKALPFYDLFAPIGEVNMQFTYEEAKKFILENFKTFSDKLSNYAKKAFENNWIDLEPREGKVGGAFCAGLHMIGESRIMSNFSGSFSDVVTLAHELGHGYHGECLKEESALNNEYPMPIAETASTFCETIVKKAAIKTASKEEAFAILESEISDSSQVIVDIYSRFLFENALFERRKTSSVSSDELKQIMIQAQKDSYGEGLDEKYLHPYMWICKPHYYSAGTNFYNFPYAFGLLFAKGLYAEYLKRGDEFVKEYDELLRVTGKNEIADITKLMNIDIHSIDFWRSSLKLIEEDVEEFMKLSEK